MTVYQLESDTLEPCRHSRGVGSKRGSLASAPPPRELRFPSMFARNRRIGEVKMHVTESHNVEFLDFSSCEMIFHSSGIADVPRSTATTPGMLFVLRARAVGILAARSVPPARRTG